MGIVVEADKSQELLSEGLIKALDAIQRRALPQERHPPLMNSTKRLKCQVYQQFE